MAYLFSSTSKQSDPRERLIPLPKYSPGPQPSVIGWSFQVQAILGLSKETDEVKSPFLLNALPAELLTKVFGQRLHIMDQHQENQDQYRTWYYVLIVLREYFKDPDTEIEYYNSLQAPTKTVPL